jgi:UDP-N-acetylmuramate dehydrogenase
MTKKELMMNNLKIETNSLPPVRGRYTADAPLGAVGWFRAGGNAEVLFKPADVDDLQSFLIACPKDIPITILGVLSNTIIRDGGVGGVTIRLGREFTGVDILEDGLVKAGAAGLDVNVSETVAQAGLTGLEFLCGVPGSIGGALAMNAGAYGGEVKDILVSADFLDRDGHLHTLTPDDLKMTYRRGNIPDGWIATSAIFKSVGRDTSENIMAHMNDIREKRVATQPIRSQTGGSTFANPKPEELAKCGLPEGTKSWQLVDKVGGRGLKIGGAQMSELHANFMINTGGATGADLENLGEEIRRRVMDAHGLDLHWEIKRIGDT